MSVNTEGRVRFLPFRTPPSSAFPAGLWTGQIFAAGDVSGGQVTLTIEVNLLTEPFSALMFTIEQVELSDDAGATRQWLLDCIGFEEHDPVGTRIPRIEFETTSANPTTAGALQASNMLRKPYFLGRADRQSGNDTAMRMITANGDGIAFQVGLFGYYWTPDAMNAAGGPQRPPGPLFGN